MVLCSDSSNPRASDPAFPISTGSQPIRKTVSTLPPRLLQPGCECEILSEHAEQKQQDSTRNGRSALVSSRVWFASWSGVSAWCCTLLRPLSLGPLGYLFIYLSIYISSARCFFPLRSSLVNCTAHIQPSQEHPFCLICSINKWMLRVDASRWMNSACIPSRCVVGHKVRWGLQHKCALLTACLWQKGPEDTVCMGLGGGGRGGVISRNMRDY